MTIIQTPVATQEEVLQALPGHDAVFVLHNNVNTKFLDTAGNFIIYYQKYIRLYISKALVVLAFKHELLLYCLFLSEI